MPHFDYGYFNTNKKVKNIRKKLLLSRTIKKKILANDFSYDYYDGDRENGYGGFKYDGRWKKFLIKIIKRYKLNKNSRVLDISAKKGFFMHDLTLLVPGIKVYGVEDHKYPIITSMKSVKGNIKFLESYCDIDYKKDFFDFVHAHNAIYRYSFKDLIKIIKIISKISKKAHITIPSYSNNLDRVKFLDWSLHGGVLLKKKEWRELFKNLGYKGDYYFSGTKSYGI
tara:strand:- start:46 stop:720 length:675 start_codon:yes stop_codon:yes gene_type:complete